METLETKPPIEKSSIGSLAQELDSRITEIDAAELVEAKAKQKRREQLATEGADMVEGNENISKRATDEGLWEIYNARLEKIRSLKEHIESEEEGMARVNDAMEDLRQKGIDVTPYEQRLEEAKVKIEGKKTKLKEMEEELDQIGRTNDWVVRVQKQVIESNQSGFAAETIAKISLKPGEVIDSQALKEDIETEVKKRKQEQAQIEYEKEQTEKRMQDGEKMDEFEKTLAEETLELKNFKREYDKEMEAWITELKSESTVESVAAAKNKIIDNLSTGGIFSVFEKKEKKKKAAQEGISELEAYSHKFRSWATRIHNKRADFTNKKCGKYGKNKLFYKITSTFFQSNDLYNKESEIMKRYQEIEKKRDALIDEIDNLSNIELDPAGEFDKVIPSREEIDRYKSAL